MVAGVLLITVAGAGAATYRRAHAAGSSASASASGRRPTPRPADGTKIREIVAGESRSCALYMNGTVVCWGESERTGTGPHDDPSPRPIEGLTDAVAVTIGDSHGCALDAAGRVTCWGYCDLACQNGNGPLLFAKPTLIAELPPLTTMGSETYEDATCGVGADDEELHCWTVMSAGATWFGDPVPARIFVYGAELMRERNGRFARGAHAGAVDLVSSSMGVSCARFRDDHARCWSEGMTDGDHLPFASLEAPRAAVARMAAGIPETCFVLVSGDVECHSTDGILRVPFGKPMRTAAAAGNAVCGTAVDGSLLCQRYDWQPGGDRNIARLQRGATFEPHVRDVGGPARAIVSGRHHFCVLRADDAVYCWNEYDRAAPERVALPATQ
jgi:hypothetical protein